MNETAIYKHIDGEEYRVEVLEKLDTQLRVKFIGERPPQLTEICWLPRSCFKKDKGEQK